MNDFRKVCLKTNVIFEWIPSGFSKSVSSLMQINFLGFFLRSSVRAITSFTSEVKRLNDKYLLLSSTSSCGYRFLCRNCSHRNFLMAGHTFNWDDITFFQLKGGTTIGVTFVDTMLEKFHYYKIRNWLSKKHQFYL